MTNQTELDPRLDSAITYLKVGYFEGALRQCRKLENSGEERRLASSHVAWLARVHLGGHHRLDAAKMMGIPQILAKLSGGQDSPEFAVCLAASGQPEQAASVVRDILKVLAAQHGILTAGHPTALLELAESALDKGENHVALSFTSVALGHRAFFVVLQDVERLARLLLRLRAPFPLWADWSAILLQHISFSHSRTTWFPHDKKATQWARDQDSESEKVLRRALEMGPVFLRDLLVRLAPHLNHDGLVTVLQDSFPPGSEGGYMPSTDPSWYDSQAIRSRFFWHDMIPGAQQDLLRNGEWAMFCTPTSDFSMALAQWWRLLESVLHQALVAPMSRLYADHPEWEQWDKDNLSKNAQKSAQIFLDLADKEKSEKFTLWQLLLLLKKCLSEKSESGSRLRKEAANFVKRYRNQVQPLVEQSWVDKAPLSEKNIDFFRNRSSHTSPVDALDAYVGRVIAGRALNLLFRPVLDERGFRYTLISNARPPLPTSGGFPS